MFGSPGGRFRRVGTGKSVDCHPSFFAAHGGAEKEVSRANEALALP